MHGQDRVIDSPAAAKLSRNAEALARDEIAARGSISFDRFMEIALYAPQVGYYTSAHNPFGSGGDFVTAPEISPLFGQAVARQCADILQQTNGAVCEFGAGSGRLAMSVLSELEVLQAVPENYFIVELNPALRDHQRTNLKAHLGADLFARLTWLQAPPPAMAGVVLANEILDALPVKLFRLYPGEIRERRVAIDDGALAFVDEVAEATLASAVAARLPWSRDDYSPGHSAEINLNADAWIGDLSRFLIHGCALISDYGDVRRAYYHPDRPSGTLMCHTRHHSHDAPLLLVGAQDITTAIDFTAVAEAADAVALDVLGFCEQSYFLLSCGIDELLGRAGTWDALQAAQQAKTLLLPAQMGSRCKFIALGKNWHAKLRGFGMRDDRHQL